jgi:hypothetical protein
MSSDVRPCDDDFGEVMLRLLQQARPDLEAVVRRSEGGTSRTGFLWFYGYSRLFTASASSTDISRHPNAEELAAEIIKMVAP